MVAYDHQIFVLQRFGGISRYFAEVACRIPNAAPLRTHVVAPLHCNEYLSTSAASTTGLFQPLSFRGSRRVYRAVNRCVEGILLQAIKPDIVHWTYFTPGKPPRGSRTVVTVYDMIHELFPTDFLRQDPTSTDKLRCVTDADHVVCISESTKNDLMRLFNVPAHKISVIHLGYSAAFRPGGPVLDSRQGIRPYLLFVGQRRGYKGFAELLRAYANSPKLRNEFDIIAFGGFEFDSSERGLLQSLNLREGSVRWMSGSDEALADAYRCARAFIYPSRYEGFGIPPLEAMSSGCPVACSNTSSIPEVVGDAAELFDPADLDAMRNAMERVCFDDERRGRLVAAGLQRAALFSWDRCAQATAAVYRQLLGT